MNSRKVRSLRVEGNVAYIPLTKGYEAVIDAADVPLVEGRFWTASVFKNTVYAMTRAKERTGVWRTVYLHRLLAGVPGQEVDHVSGDGLDNRRINLRPATKAENRRNRRVGSANTSGIKGVHLDAFTGRWRAEIEVDGVKHRLGRFATQSEAASVYAAASVRLHGDFGRQSHT